MSFIQSVRTGWRQFFSQITPQEREKLLTWLRDCYRKEVQDGAQFRRHAERMYYSQFRERLQQIAVEEQGHVQWLHQQILALGGQPPIVSRTLKAGDNNWQNLLLDFDEEKQSCTTLLEGIELARHVDHNIVKGLQRIRQEELRHREEIRTMLMKSEPDAIPVPEQLNEETARQKQAWLEQQKMAWMAQQQAAWEAAGKPIPWAEWEREQEFKWSVELPQYELRWARRLSAAEETTLSRSEPSC
jgi:rubrerythrin